MKKTIFTAFVLSIFSILSAQAIEYPDIYCSDAAWSYSLPNTLNFGHVMPEERGYYTVGRYKIGDFYYDIVNKEKREAAIVTKEKVFETTVGWEIAGITPSVKDWPFTTFEGDIEIPSEVTINDVTYSVVMIGYGVFYGSENLRSVKIPESVRFISSRVFFKCDNLVEVSIPDGVYIAPDAFSKCPSLERLDLSHSKMERLKLFENFNLKNLILPTFLIEGYSRIEFYYSSPSVWSQESVPPSAGLIYIGTPETILYVPRGSAQSYKDDREWRNFPNIVEYDVLGQTGVESIEAAGEAKPEYYDMLGRRASGTEPGIFLRRSGDKTEKIIISK